MEKRGRFFIDKRKKIKAILVDIKTTKTGVKFPFNFLTMKEQQEQVEWLLAILIHINTVESRIERLTIEIKQFKTPLQVNLLEHNKKLLKRLKRYYNFKLKQLKQF